MAHPFLKGPLFLLWPVALAFCHCTLALDFDALSEDPLMEPDTECLEDKDCDDQILCTEESCNDALLCERKTNDALCVGLEVCDLQQGCVPSGLECEEDFDCKDEFDCTDDFCMSNECFNRPLDWRCDNGDLCIFSWNCSPTEGCSVVEEQTCTDPDPITSPCIKGVCNSSTGHCELQMVPGADDDTDSYLDHLCGGADCNDSRGDVNPGATELCDNGIDDDCNGLTDTDC